MTAVVPAGAPAPPGVWVETATWRPVEVVDVDGWLLGRSGGFTRRANSVVAARAPGDVGAALARVAELCAERDVPAIFRVDADARPRGLDDVLAARGYARVATTRVMVAGVPAPGADASLPGGVSVDLADAPDRDWLGMWLDVKAGGGDHVDHAVARSIVTGSPATYVTARDADGVAGVVRAGYARDWVGLSCLMVAPRARRRGLGRALSVLALAAAARRDARRAFLQVEQANAGAAALYAGLGFRVADEHHYRER